MVLPCEEIEESLTNFVGFHILCFQFFALFIRHTPQIPAACAQAVIRSNPRNLKKLQDCKITYFTLILHHFQGVFQIMARKKQTFDPHALTREVVSATHEVVTVPFRLRTYRVIRKILIIFIAVSIVNVVFANIFYTPKMYRILRENSELVFKYRLLQDKIRAEQRKLNEIHHRDNFVYRALFSADTLNIGGIYTPLSGVQIRGSGGRRIRPADDRHVAAGSTLSAARLSRTSVSFDELQILAKNKENMSTAIPAIWPIDRQALRHGIEPFGYRNHPIYHRRILHKGIDLAANIGNNVYATGDATVQSTDLGQPRRGYGKQILLNHQYGYQTRYAHLSQIFVKPGEKVVRGQLIGKVGNTGGVTGPHLHYEVIHMGQVVNPINYFNRNMTNEEYERLMEQMQEPNLDTFDE